MAEIILTSKNFEEEVIKSDIPVVVDFWAVWCAPCKMLSPVVSEIAKKYEGKVKVGKVNVDEEPELAFKYKISSIPAVILFKNGEPAEASIGFKPEEQLIASLKL